MVISVSTLATRESFSFVCESGDGTPIRVPGVAMQFLPYLGDVREVADANELIRSYGEYAGSEAAARADRSRDLGNHIHFCRWRQIERLVVLMSIPRAVGTIH